MIKVIEELNSGNHRDEIPYQAVALKYGVADTALRRRYLGINEPREVKHLWQQLLTPEQEAVPVAWINDEKQGMQPPNSPLVAQKAPILAGRAVGNGWVYRFLKRHKDTLIYKRAPPMDHQRVEADSYANYQA